MRITAQQAETVRLFTHRHFGEDATIWLFGSRADDNKRGGDYDFFIETSLDQPDSIIEHKITMIVELQSTASFEDEKIGSSVFRGVATICSGMIFIANERPPRLQPANRQ